MLFNLVNNFFLLFLLGFFALLLYFFAKIVVGLISPVRYYWLIEVENFRSLVYLWMIVLTYLLHYILHF